MKFVMSSIRLNYVRSDLWRRFSRVLFAKYTSNLTRERYCGL